MADKEDTSLREFAGIIQEKAGPVGSVEEKAHPAKPASPGAAQSPPDGGLAGLQSTLRRQPRAVVAGIAAGAGVAIGYLLGKLGRK